MVEGAILRYRSVPNNLNAQIPNVVTNLSATYQILFRTTDAIGRPAAAATTLFVPSNPDPNKLLSYQLPYDTPDADCAPSYAFRVGAVNGIPTAQGVSLILLMIAAVNKGWYVTSPDHEGLHAALNVVPVQGHATLDALRACLRSGSVTGLSPDAGAATWGYSGGALAGVATAELQGSYAPELNLVGSAFGGIGLGSTLEAINTAASAPGSGTARIIGSVCCRSFLCLPVDFNINAPTSCWAWRMPTQT